MLWVIVAMTKTGVIGNRGSLPWHIPEDFQHFKKETLGHVLIMGRKTHESVIAQLGGKPLPGRTHVVLTRNEVGEAKGCVKTSDRVVVAGSLDEALDQAKALCEPSSKIFIAGGGEIYAQTLHLVTHMILTRIRKLYDGDTYFPAINYSEWKLTKERKGSEVDFQYWERKRL